MANLVAKRCAVLQSAAERRVAWFLQWRSWQAPGLVGVPIARPERFCLDPGAKLSAAQLDELEKFRHRWIAGIAAGRVWTRVGRQIAEALDYTQSARAITVIDGPARIGKSYAAKAWCDESGGLARYCQVPSSGDELSFMRAIAKALGVSINLNSKVVELRARVEETLHCGDLMLVLDEAAYLWPQVWQRYAMPSRVEWVMSAGANFDVPIALVSAPHFYQAQQKVEKLTGWNSAQFIGRIGHVERLPDCLDEADLVKVAKALLPEGNALIYAKLAVYAGISKRGIASIEAVIKRARWLASKEGRNQATREDVDRAINESVIPSDSALAVALQRNRRDPIAEHAPEACGGPDARRYGTQSAPIHEPGRRRAQPLEFT